MYTEKQLREAFTAGRLSMLVPGNYSPTEDEFIDSLKEAVDKDMAEALEIYHNQFDKPQTEKDRLIKQFKDMLNNSPQ